MDNSKRQSATPQRRVSDFVQSVDANRFFNLLTVQSCWKRLRRPCQSIENDDTRRQ